MVCFWLRDSQAVETEPGLFNPDPAKPSTPKSNKPQLHLNLPSAGILRQQPVDQSMSEGVVQPMFGFSWG